MNNLNLSPNNQSKPNSKLLKTLLIILGILTLIGVIATIFVLIISSDNNYSTGQKNSVFIPWIAILPVWLLLFRKNREKADLKQQKALYIAVGVGLLALLGIVLYLLFSK